MMVCPLASPTSKGLHFYERGGVSFGRRHSVNARFGCQLSCKVQYGGCRMHNVIFSYSYPRIPYGYARGNGLSKTLLEAQLQLYLNTVPRRYPFQTAGPDCGRPHPNPQAPIPKDRVRKLCCLASTHMQTVDSHRADKHAAVPRRLRICAARVRRQRQRVVQPQRRLRSVHSPKQTRPETAASTATRATVACALRQWVQPVGIQMARMDSGVARATAQQAAFTVLR